MSIKLQDTSQCIHNQVLEIIEIIIFFIPEEAMSENWQKQYEIYKFVYKNSTKIQKQKHVQKFKI